MSNWFSTTVAPVAAETIQASEVTSRRVKDEKHTAVRAWARTQGINVGKRGRVPNDVIARYDEAHKDLA